MTGIDLFIGMALQTCVIFGHAERNDILGGEGKTFAIDRYECPLLGDGAVFFIWSRVCSNGEVKAFMLQDQRTNRGYTINQFGAMEPSFVDILKQDIYYPGCK
jgi:hypothetical protein